LQDIEIGGIMEYSQVIKRDYTKVLLRLYDVDFFSLNGKMGDTPIKVLTLSSLIFEKGLYSQTS